LKHTKMLVHLLLTGCSPRVGMRFLLPGLAEKPGGRTWTNFYDKSDCLRYPSFNVRKSKNVTDRFTSVVTAECHINIEGRS